MRDYLSHGQKGAIKESKSALFSINFNYIFLIEKIRKIFVSNHECLSDNFESFDDTFRTVLRQSKGEIDECKRTN